MEAVSAATAFFAAKLSTIAAAGVMALLGFALDSRRHSVPTAMLAMTAGIAVAILLSDPVADYLHLSDMWKNGVSGALGIGGRGLIISVSRLSRDPAYLLRIWRGQDEKDDSNKDE